MGKITAWLYGLGLGAGLMYFYDPVSGNRRKALLRDRVVRLQREGDEAINVAVRDLRNRATGVISQGKSMVSREGGSERGMSQGMSFGESRMQGGEGQPGSMMWSPSTRLLAGLGGAYLMVYGMARGGIIGLLARLSGIVIGARALTNMDVKTMAGQGTEGAIHVQKSININAPIDEVYTLWSNFENFSRFMNNIEAIHNTGEGRSHWIVKGPAGSKVEFDAITTEDRPNDVIAWETTPDSQVKHSGQVRFRESQKGTQVNVTMDYTPPAGVAGHAVAKLFGKDPKTEMDADLARMKTLLEQGKTRTQGSKVTRDEVMPVTGSKQKGQQSGSQQKGMDRDFSAMDQEESAFSRSEGISDSETSRMDHEDDENRNMGGIGGGPLNTNDL